MEKIAKEILQKNKIKIKSIEKKESFNNEVYLINNKYILRIRKIPKPKFIKSIFLLDIFKKSKIKVPQILTSGKYKNKDYYLYKKVDGDRLYTQWHKLKNKERENIIKETCKTIKQINKIKYSSKFKNSDLKIHKDWKQKIKNDINKNLNYCLKNKILSKTEYEKLKLFCEKNYFVFNKDKNYLSYIDLHFGNIIIKNNKFSGIIDFDDVNYYPLDYTLTTINKFTENPKLFASEDEEKSNTIKETDYKNVKKWIKEYYPELFNFRNLETRLKLYSIEYDTSLLKDWPKCKSLRKRLFDNIK